jgi:hypothetical protein
MVQWPPGNGRFYLVRQDSLFATVALRRSNCVLSGIGWSMDKAASQQAYHHRAAGHRASRTITDNIADFHLW